MGKKSRRWAKPDINVADTKASDADVRGDAVRALCPCHVGWEVFEQNISVVVRHLRDRSRIVRAQALHVFEDAARMQLAEDLKLQLEPGEELIRQKHAQHFPSIVERLRASRNIRFRKRKRRYRLEARIRKSKIRS
ncbi:MAG TPA: hypothetical protein VFR80_13660 [Pyrinomonadaceae bacterium]|nr:hypothetical protein [Pyrinomonadaceae bacterium]